MSDQPIQPAQSVQASDTATPRTDRFEEFYDFDVEYKRWRDFARQLERELTARTIECEAARKHALQREDDIAKEREESEGLRGKLTAANESNADLSQVAAALLERAEDAEIKAIGIRYAAQMLRQAVGLDDSKEDLREVAILFDEMKKQRDAETWRLGKASEELAKVRTERDKAQADYEEALDALAELRSTISVLTDELGQCRRVIRENGESRDQWREVAGNLADAHKLREWSSDSPTISTTATRSVLYAYDALLAQESRQPDKAGVSEKQDNATT